MCTVIEFSDGDVVESQGELAAKLGIPVAELGGEPEVCFCQVDVPAVLARNGYVAEVGWETHLVDWFARPVAPAPPTAPEAR